MRITNGVRVLLAEGRAFLLRNLNAKLLRETGGIQILNEVSES
jgi:hypothetical protein